MVGGLTELGFAPNTSLLLVVGHQGRGVIDCSTGQRVARDRDEDSSRWFDPTGTTALGIDPLDGMWITVAGLNGGSPDDVTADGWRAIPQSDGVLLSVDGIEQPLSTGSEDVRAYCFSPDGRFFALATPSDVTIYARS